MFAMNRAVVTILMRGARAGMRLRRASWTVLEELLIETLTTQQKAMVTQIAYDVFWPQRYDQPELFEWETEWLRRRLVSPPARVLVGGAGSGREVRFLLEQGYEVDAFEPTPRLWRNLDRVAGDSCRVWRASYAEWVAFRRTAAAGHDRVYDAMLLGWGSLSHVLDAQERFDVLRAACEAVPHGPVLASFFLRPVSHAAVHHPGRARSIGRRLARLVGSRRGAVEEPSAERFLLHAGFAHAYSEQEIEQVIARIPGRTLVWEARHNGYPHVTVLPVDREAIADRQK